jgi:hypothetical protein
MPHGLWDTGLGYSVIEQLEYGSDLISRNRRARPRVPESRFSPPPSIHVRQQSPSSLEATYPPHLIAAITSRVA